MLEHPSRRRVPIISIRHLCACLDERVRELQKVVIGQPQLPQRSLERRAEHFVPQGLEAVERQLQASETQGAKPDREVCQHVAVRIKRLKTVPGALFSGFRRIRSPVSFEFVRGIR